MPGGLGTLDELFEAATLIQCHKIGPFPLILMGSEFWKGFRRWAQSMMREGVFSRDEIGFAYVTDSPKKVVDLIVSGLHPSVRERLRPLPDPEAPLDPETLPDIEASTAPGDWLSPRPPGGSLTVKITIVGAAGGEVTGSAYYVQTKHAGMLVDCRDVPGGQEVRSAQPPADGAQAEARRGPPDPCASRPCRPSAAAGQARTPGSPVYATPATAELAGLILGRGANPGVRQRAAEPETQAQRDHRSEIRSTRPSTWTSLLKHLREVPYQDPVEVAPGIQARWAESGHMLGSASIQLLVEEGGTTKRVVFSGDIGPMGIPILKDFEPFHRADMVFVESTYGDHDHRPFRETVEEFVVRHPGDAVGHGGRVLVPTFAVGRAQLLTGLLAWMFRNGEVEPFPVFLDSPMAIETTEIYAHHRELFDEQMTEFVSVRPMREDLHTLKMCATAEESRKINEQTGPFLVMAGAGMCNAGRILHHLKAHLWQAPTPTYSSSGIRATAPWGGG